MIPTIYILKDLNKVLLCISKLTGNVASPTKKSILRLVSSISFGDKKGHDDTLSFLSDYELVDIKDSRYKITISGRDFIGLNLENFIEINQQQKEFLITLLLRNKKFKAILDSLLEKYGFYLGNHNIVINISEDSLTEEQFRLIDALRWLRLFRLKGQTVSIVQEYIKLINVNNHLSLKDLLSLLQSELEYSHKAEVYALKLERSRLEQLGKSTHAKLVKLVSESNVELGYDLLSFNGDNQSLQYDRFIEVKCSKSAEVRFYWSLNEFEVARKLKNQYWIYFFPEVTKSKSPIIFNNPASLFKPPKYNMISSEFIVEEVG